MSTEMNKQELEHQVRFHCEKALEFEARATKSCENGIAVDSLPDGHRYCAKNADYHYKRAGRYQAEIIKLEKLD